MLDILEGTWVNRDNPHHNKHFYGLHTTCMPSPGSNSEQIPGKFHFICDNYIEELTFKKIGPAGIRNRGGTNEQFCGAIEYHQQITRVDNETGQLLNVIHVETGMYLNMQSVFLRPATEESIKTDVGDPELFPGCGSKDKTRGPIFVPKQTICRSGTIPHGSTVQLLGAPTDPNNAGDWQSGAPHWPTGPATWPHRLHDPLSKKTFDNPERVHLAISATMGSGVPLDSPMVDTGFDLDKPPPADITKSTETHDNPGSNLAYTQRIILHPNYPYSVRPDLRLRDANKHLNIVQFKSFSLDTKNDSDPGLGVGGPHGGIINVPFVARYTPVTRVMFNVWISRVKDEHGHEHDQLQYEQICAFQFGFGTDGGATVWPHIQVNTLVRKK
jgi:hypothetical protein